MISFFIILQDTVEKKLSQMILDKKFHGMNMCLSVYTKLYCEFI